MHSQDSDDDNCEQESFVFERVMTKSATFGVTHLGIAFGVSYTLPGSVALAGAITIVESLVNTVAHFFFVRWWGRHWDRRWDRSAQALPALAAGATP